MAKRSYDAHPFSDGPAVADAEGTLLLPTPTTSDIANAVECEYMVYGTFRTRFTGLDARRNYNGTHLYVPCANGQIVKVTVDVLDAPETTRYHNGETP